MDFSSSSSSSSSQYRSSAFPANSSRPNRWDLPIYESTPHFPPPPLMENRIIALNSPEISSSMQESGRLASSSSPSYSTYVYDYSSYNYGGGGASTAGREVEMAEKRGEGGDRPPGESSAAEEVEREHMFDKVVTPSDVGKLNRLVIPKQHAEKYFPMDSSSSDKGLLLDFEDRNGKSWRFRYSYWNSSQSYVMTKGWSRFVKEKKLDAGDVVSFQRGLGDAAKDRFYIDWRRRPGAPPPPPHHHHHHIQFQHGFSLHRSNIQRPPFLLAGQQPPPPLPPPPLALHHQARDHRQLMSPNHHRGSVISYSGLGTAATSSGYNEDNNNYGVLTPNFCHQGSVVYMRGPPQHQMQMQMELVGTSRRNQNQNQTTSSTSGAASDEPMVLDSFPVAPAAAKRLRLFGVNMDCTVDQDSEVPADVNPTVVMGHSSSSAEEADGSLQLRLHGSATPSSSSMQTTTTDFLDKGCCSCRCFLGQSPSPTDDLHTTILQSFQKVEI